MRRYYIALVAFALVLTLAAFAVQWLAPACFLTVMPLLALYFAVVLGVQHYIVLKSMKKSPRQFVQFFLGSTVAVLFIHLVVLASYLFTHTDQAKSFTLAFCIGFASMLVFETVALILFVKRQRKNQS